MWLESHANLARHPKTRRLMKRLGWSLPDTIGNLHLFWYWALDFAPTGDLTPYTPEELTADLDLLGASPEEFIEAMVAAGFLDRVADTLRIHDWVDYQRPKPRQKPTGSSRPTESRTKREPQKKEPESKSVVQVNRSEGATHPALAGSEEDTVGNALRAVPRISTQDSAIPNIDSISNTGETKPEQASTHISITESNNATACDTGTPTTRTAAEELELRKTFPANLWRLPGFTKHWWPLYIDFHTTAGTPLTKDAQAKFLAQLAQHPLSAVQRIKENIRHSVRSDFTESKAPASFTRHTSSDDVGAAHSVRSGILEHAP